MVVDAINASSLPGPAKEALLTDVANRRFDIQIFTGETTNLTASKLDRLREVIGRGVTNVIVLPKKKGL